MGMKGCFRMKEGDPLTDGRTDRQSWLCNRHFKKATV